MENSKPHDKSKSFTQVYNSFASLFNLLQESDMPPNGSVIGAVNTSEKNGKQLEEIWMKIKTVDIPQINNELKKASLPAIII
jgi:hypothetical protein